MSPSSTAKSGSAAASSTTETKAAASAAKKSASKKTAKKTAAKKTTKKTAKKAAATSAKKTSAKKTSAKATTAEKTTAKKATAKKATAKKTTSKKAAKKTTAKKTAAKKTAAAPKADEGGASLPSGTGKQLVIVESPAKAKTINKYLGPGFVVQASVGHIRDLPTKAVKGTKQPVPGVDIEHDFQPTYVVLPTKAKTVNELKRLAKSASQVWFATDLDREGEAIAWHLAQVLGIPPASAKRVVFNAITATDVRRAFANPRAIDEDKVNAQQARRILDRIVGYQASPLLWKKVARGLSAGRVQSVAVRLIVEREREIAAFVPDERWQVAVRLAAVVEQSAALIPAWRGFRAETDAKGKGPTIREQNRWMSEHSALRAELVELAGERFELGSSADEARDLSEPIKAVARAVGMPAPQVTTRENPEAKGPARWIRSVDGELPPSIRYRVKSIETRRTQSRPPAPFITSSLQIAAANQLGFSAQRTMRTAQSLYEGVAIPGEGQVGLITYMRTDSTNLSAEALAQLRGWIQTNLGGAYLPANANVYSSSNKDAQEAHEAIRPTDASRTPAALRAALTDDQFKLYNLIWSRAVAGQMTPALWDATTILLERSDAPTRAVVKTTGRTLAFDGYLKIAGLPSSDEQTLPPLAEGQILGAFAVEPEQRFSSPPPRYSEASLVKTLEAEGIGRPSTYASIIQVIQDRKYVEQLDRRFYATDLGDVVTSKLIEAFPDLMDVGYTRAMESELDEIEDQSADWVKMLDRFYDTFKSSLESAHEQMTHAKAEIQPAIYACPKCGSRTCYRFGKNGRFLSCTTYPECDYAAPIDREGKPLLPERVDIVCPEDGSAMELRSSRFGPFIASVEYPATKYVINLDKRSNVKVPTTPPLVTSEACEKCGSPLNLRMGKRGPWLGCSRFPKCRGRMAWNKLSEARQTELSHALDDHLAANPPVVLRRRDGSVIPDGTPVSTLLIPGGVAELPIHTEAAAELAGGAPRPGQPTPAAGASASA
ncbi:MAG: type I DNA topoisomerase [Myxococcales bacterium]|nr:type I DNA topoisomerase [Myxococcales bacterium]MCB9702953.1 type I DNA topoisomerase [Myxococcales bacterium]